ncbi:MAG: response regulator transcription factor [Gemmatimonadaceae bacterium]|nr:response regulator transcription factor [Gemmatimonadaceae bacterium]
MSRPIRVLIVDDEPLARGHLRQLLGDDADVTVIGEAGNGRDAVAAIREHAPDLVLLDIQMPELDGFGVVREIGVEQMPPVIFVTAYDEFALQAFEVYAMAYLLKPVDRGRFAEALHRVKSHIRRGAPADDLATRLAALLEAASVRETQLERLAIKVDGRILFVRTDDIDWVEAVDNHVRLHVGTRHHLVRGTLTALERRLPASKFLRTHRSMIVNVQRIAEIQPWFGGDYVIILADGTRHTTGRSYRQKVHEFVQRSL